MILTDEQSTLITTALQNMRSEMYIQSSLSKMGEISELIKMIEEETQPKDLSQKIIMLEDIPIEVGSETGIEEYANELPPRNCEVCD